MFANTATRVPEDRVSPTIGRYEIIARIGRGGMGQVYLARVRAQGAFERLFAVKVMNECSERSRFVSTLLNEARVASRIQHRNVVGIIDIGEDATGPFIVMEYVEGCTFAELQSRWQDDRPPRLILPMIIDVLYGLHAVHTARNDDGAPLHLVHRDVSPQNLLVGVDGACRVTDFGLARARALLHADERSGFTGKPAYMSPEQVRGEQVDHRSDVFSTGVVLWNALTGKRLFHDSSPHAAMFHVLKRKIPRPSGIGLKPTARFDRIVMKALERDPDKRYQSAEEMANELREAAISSRCLGSPSEISEWLSASFGPDLQARRRLIQQASERVTSGLVDDSIAISGSVPTLALPWLEESPTMGRVPDSERLSVGELAMEPASFNPSSSMRVASTNVTYTEASGRPKWLLPMSAAAVLLLLFGAAFAFSRATAGNRGGASAQTPAAVPAVKALKPGLGGQAKPADAPAAMPDGTSVPLPASPPPASPELAPPAAESEAQRPPVRHDAPPTRWRAARAHERAVAPASPPANPGNTAPAPKADVAARPAPGIEENPYLH